ncbi:hypothetical protein V7S43_015655 [Phytophthora oleae]|uniref:RxLR effector protein n=1 Tax=Phytophthora oleae TaxID=2107226 RepID=A0ABD3EZ78_9STRA
MQFSRCLLAEVFLLLFSSIICASKADSNHISAPDTYVHGRLLRGADSSTEEDRGLWTELKSGVKTAWWSRREKSAAYVKAKLKLTGLDDAAMKASKNYHTYQVYLYKVEGLKLDKWVYGNMDTSSKVWKRFGLGQMTSAQRKSSPKLQTYEHFLKKYDDAVYKHGFAFQFPESKPEMEATLRIWEATNRPESYVKKLLKIDDGEDEFDVITHSVVTYYKSEK